MAAYEDSKGIRMGELDQSSAHQTDISWDEKKGLQAERTFSKIDVENRVVYKGDDSDGAVEWTFRSIMASIFLCTLYTGR